MEIKHTQKQSHVRAEVKVPGKKMLEHYDRIYHQIAPNVSIPGFRPGKAPKTMIVEAYGAGRIQNMATEEAIREGLQELLRENHLNPLGMPAISIVKQPQFIEDGDATLEFTIEFDVLPEVKFTGDYKKIKLSPAPQVAEKVTSEEIDKTLKMLARRMAEYKSVSRSAKIGDKVEISFQGFSKKVAIEQLASKNHPVILGDNSLIPGFEEKLIGAKTGEKREFDITFPKDYYAKEFAGNKYHFEVTVEKVEEIITPKIDNEFAKKINAKSLDDLKDLLKKSIVADKERKAKQVTEDELIGKLIKIARVDLPATLVESEKQRLKKSIEDMAAQQGITFDKYLENINATPDKFDEDLTKQAGKNILIGLALGQIAKNEKIKLAKEETLTKVVQWLIENNQPVHQVKSS